MTIRSSAFIMTKNLKQETVTGMLWSLVERFGSLLIQFIANIFLARLLTPIDFGLIGMIMLFIALSNTIVDSGLSAALIQKKEVTQLDYSTIFYVNMILALILFSLLFLTAPLISNFYNQNALTSILRVLSFLLIINAFNIIQFTQLTRSVYFKKIAKVNIVSTILACTISIILALKGFGVWSLVIQMISIALFRTIFLFLWNSWYPSLQFSFNSLSNLFAFGSRLLFSSLLDTLYVNIQTVIIGKVFSVRDLGFYTQAFKLSDVPVSTISGVVSQVTFPVFSRLQDDHEKMKYGVRKSLKSLVYLNFPIMILLIVIAKPLFWVLFTEIWSESIPYFQILCLSGMLLALHISNLNILKATGNSKLFFKIEIAKKILGIIAISIGIQFGIKGMLYSMVISSYLFFVLNAYFSGKVIKYGFFEQLKDIFPAYALSVFVGLMTYYFVQMVETNTVINLIISIFIYITLYLSISKILRFEAIDLFYSVLKERLNLNKFTSK